MSKSPYLAGRDQGKVFLDVVCVNTTNAMRESLCRATGGSPDTHMLLDRSAIPVLQGIEGAANKDDLRRECKAIAIQIQTNGIIILCPKDAR